LLHSLRQGKLPRPQPCAEGGEVFVISAGRPCRQPLEKQQIEFRRLADQAGQQGVDLAAVVGLVIEPVRQRRGQRLLELLRRRDAAYLIVAAMRPSSSPSTKSTIRRSSASRAARSSSKVSNNS
jgi:hypothetical protein